MDTPAAGVLLFCGLLSYLAFRTAFFGMKLMAACGWFGWAIYAVAHPPFSLTAGEDTHTALIIVSIGTGLMIVLAGLGRGISRTEDKTGAFSTSSEGFHFRLPDWLRASSPSENEKITRERVERETEEYRDKLHKALNPPRKRSGR